MEIAKQRIVNGVSVDEETGCWNWKGNPRENGYCRTTYKRKNYYLHRLSYKAFIGEIPEGMDVCHKCDNRRCCNPDHLFAGTRKDNMQDAVSKNRQAKGFKLPGTKLSEVHLMEIVARAKSGEKYKSIAKDFGITKSHAGKCAIKQGVRRNGKRK